MSEKETLIPVAFCFICKSDNPVVIEDVPMDIIGDGLAFTAIYCPMCENVINAENSVEVQYYNGEELEKIGWKLDDN